MSKPILKGIGFENFRVFEQQTMFDFSPLTILTGTNSSGKSSVINGLKLVRESFRNVNLDNKPEDFELDSLFSLEFNASEMMKRYGTLDKYINHAGREEGNNNFVISIPTQMVYVREKLLISYTVEVDNNEQKSGSITAIEMKLVNQDTSLVKIEKTVDTYCVNVNLSAFMQILERKKDILEGISTPDYPEIGDILAAVLDQIEAGKLYDFSFLWAEDPADEQLFEFVIKKFYGAYDADSLKKLCEDIFSTLSSHQWLTKRIKFIIYFKDKYSKDNIGLSLLDAALRYDGEVGGKSIPDNGARSRVVLRLKTGFEKLSWETIENLNDKSDFLQYLFKLIVNKQNYYDKLWINEEEKRFIKPEERTKTEIKSFKPSETEKRFYTDYLFPNLNLIKQVFMPFQSLETISSERSSTKGIKSILDSDDFSRLLKQRFSATGLMKEAFDKLDAFLNKWLLEFKVAEKIEFLKDEGYDVFKVRLMKNGRWMMLSDEGFGVAQVLPVILACCPIMELNYEYTLEPSKYNEPKLVLIEEPETNLHPALQSKLADMFMDAVKTFNIRFVIETHSEYLIRKLQYLTGKGDIKPEDTVIYYFYPPTEVSPGEKQVKKINIQKDGSLTDDFGTGFFDEATNWKFELLALKNHRKN